MSPLPTASAFFESARTATKSQWRSLVDRYHQIVEEAETDPSPKIER
jgi:hypothetical protein